MDNSFEKLPQPESVSKSESEKSAASPDQEGAERPAASKIDMEPILERIPPIDGIFSPEEEVAKLRKVPKEGAGASVMDEVLAFPQFEKPEGEIVERMEGVRELIEENLPESLSEADKKQYMVHYAEWELRSSRFGVMFANHIGLESAEDLDLSHKQLQEMADFFKAEQPSLTESHEQALEYRLYRLQEDRRINAQVQKSEQFTYNREKVIRTIMSSNTLVERMYQYPQFEGLLLGTKPAFTLDSEQERRIFTDEILPEVRKYFGVGSVDDLVFDPIVTREVIEENMASFTGFGFRPGEKLNRDRVNEIMQKLNDQYCAESGEGRLSAETDEALGAVLGIPKEAREEYRQYKNLQDQYEARYGTRLPGITALSFLIKEDSPHRPAFESFLSEYLAASIPGRIQIRSANRDFLEEVYRETIPGGQEELASQMIQAELDKRQVYHWGLIYMVYEEDEYRSEMVRARGKRLKPILMKEAA